MNKIETATLLRDRITPEMLVSRAFYENDLWREGKGLAVKKPETDAAKMAEIKEGFATQNVIEEVVDRKRDGILGRDPLWKLVNKDGTDLTKQQEILVEEMEAALTEWWNTRENLGITKDSYTGAMLDRRSELRPFAPPAAYDKSGSLQTVKSYKDALNLLHFEVKSPKEAGVFADDNTLEKYSVYEYQKGGNRYVEVSLTDAEGLTHFTRIKQEDVESFAVTTFPNSLGIYAEKTWYQKAVELAKKIINKEASKAEVNYQPMDLDGKLYLYELDLKRPFVTAPMCGLQQQISLDYTMKGRNTYTAGFRGIHWLNARPPQGTRTVTDADAPGGTRVETYDLPMKAGAGVNSFVQGTKIFDEEGKVKGIATPNAIITEPVETRTFIESKNDNRAGILAMAKQEHVMTNTEAAPSGFSRQQARSEFKSSLNQDAAYIDGEGRYIIEFAVMFAANLTGKVEEFKKLRCDFKTIIDAGILSPEEKEDNRKAYEVSEISLETLMSRNGVEDTVAELGKIKSEDGYEINRLDKVLGVLAKANGKLPLNIQIEFLVKSLGKEGEWDAATIVKDLTAENEQKRKDEAAKSNGALAFSK